MCRKTSKRKDQPFYELALGTDKTPHSKSFRFNRIAPVNYFWCTLQNNITNINGKLLSQVSDCPPVGWHVETKTKVKKKCVRKLFRFNLSINHVRLSVQKEGRKTASGQMAKKWPLLASSSSSRIDLRFKKVSLSGPEGIEEEGKRRRAYVVRCCQEKNRQFLRELKAEFLNIDRHKTMRCSNMQPLKFYFPPSKIRIRNAR